MKEPMAEIHEDQNGLLRRSDMTLRDWFAGQALMGHAHTYDPQTTAESAYELADAMLAARNNNTTENKG